MATVRAYWGSLRNTRNTIAQLLGTDIRGADTQVRAVSGADLATVAIVMKALVDKGLISNAELDAARDAALAELWDTEQPLP